MGPSCLATLHAIHPGAAEGSLLNFQHSCLPKSILPACIIIVERRGCMQSTKSVCSRMT